MQTTLTCPTCSKQFTPTKGRQRVCSPDCYRRPPAAKQCRGCGRRFTEGSAQRRYCSQCQPVKTCLGCGKSFTPASNRQAYCTEACRGDQAQCEHCGKAFRVKANTTGRWCSGACSSAGGAMPEMRRRPCEQCGTEYKPARAEQRWCSRACAHKAHAVTPKVCTVCNNEFTKYGNQATCSRKCASQLRRATGSVSCKRCGQAIPQSPGGYQRVYCSDLCRRVPLGTTSVTPLGYVREYVGEDHPSADDRGWMFQHRKVVEDQIGRPLEPHERVHHKNGDRACNDPANLELWKVKGKDPAGVRAADYHCPGCRCHE